MNTKISVIVPTYKRSNSLRNLLDSLESQLTADMELIIVEQYYNNSDLYKKLPKKYQSRFKYIFVKHKSLPFARNVGVKNSSSPIILFLDDDVILEKDLITNHLSNYKDPKIGGVAGRVLTPGQKIDLKKMNVGKISILGNFSDGFSSSIKQETDTVIGCNCSWRKEIFQKIGGFDTNFKGNALREDSDFSLRVKKLGYTIIFEPTATVHHLRELEGGSRKTEGRIQWYHDFFSNETYFFLKHRNKLLLPLMLIQRWEWFIRSFLSFTRGERITHSISAPFKGIIDGIIEYRKI